MVFNLSVGYNLEGIHQPNMQWFLNQMHDCSEYKPALVDELAKLYPEVRSLNIPNCLSDNVTLSTMHGCPPEEIESISTYLLRDRHLHTLVKCNPTLLGPKRVRALLNEDLGYKDVVVPDAAFEHDLKYPDAVPMLRNLKNVADECGLEFGVKLSNTLEVENSRATFDAAEETMYLSGRPVTRDHGQACERSGRRVRRQAAHVIFGGSELLQRTGFARRRDADNHRMFRSAEKPAATCVCFSISKMSMPHLTKWARSASKSLFSSQQNRTPPGQMYKRPLNSISATTSNRLAETRNILRVRLDTAHTKTSRELGLFDCIKAPCVDECPVNQNVPQYMSAVRNGDNEEALRVVRADNPIACILGRVCDHLCEQTCVRSHLDEPVAIRDIKRFIMDLEERPVDEKQSNSRGRQGRDHRGRPQAAWRQHLSWLKQDSRWKYSNSMPTPAEWSAVPFPNTVFRRRCLTRTFRLLQDPRRQIPFRRAGGA